MTTGKPSNPKVSVVCVTYNQEQYIRQTLDGFVMQKTDFAFEVIIADDCSSDNTPAIIEEYSQKYPDIFKPILRRKNVGVLQNFLGALRASKGDYIALCEGDDYWTDPEKLQKQADFLDNNKTYALCFHPVKVVFENNEKETEVFPKLRDKSKFTLELLLKQNFIQTNSVMYRRQTYEVMPENIMPVDWYLHVYHAKYGNIGFINRTMSVYRRHPGGLWWDSYNDLDSIWRKHGLAHLELFIEMLKLYGNNKTYRSIINNSLYMMFVNLIHTDEKYKEGMYARAAKKFPEASDDFAFYIHDRLSKRELEIEDLKQQNQRDRQKTDEAYIQLHEKEEAIKRMDQELSRIKTSRLWKLRNLLARIMGKPVD